MPTGEISVERTYDIPLSARPIVVGDTAYVVGDGTLSALTLSSGSIEWTHPISDGPVGLRLPHLVAGDRVVLPDEEIVALDRTTGSVVWEFGPADAIQWNLPNAVCPHDIRLAAAESGSIYAGVQCSGSTGDQGSSETAVFKLDTATGEERWHVDGVTEVDPIAVSDSMLFGLSGNDVVAYSGPRGAEQWRAGLANAVSDLSAVDGTLYLAGSHTVKAIESQTGTERWTFELRGSNMSYLTVSDDSVYVLSGGPDGASLCAIDARAGRERWRYDCHIPIYFHGPHVTGGTVYAVVGSVTAGLDIAALDASNGEHVGELVAQSGSGYLEPVVAGGKLYALPYREQREAPTLIVATGTDRRSSRIEECPPTRATGTPSDSDSQ